ncbi:uncharacterized protein CELE_C47E12.9 [Caenorhabditis elegans]|uniref:Uncharacterized protein n=1 Tax=Caenorhabditis elegans TaxID=6239 RepID=Q18676_CAEEL|nr:Uncharacterized protein CELE_C47E12.9 [Caenorhabditis elegans]CAA93103.2 Uncharacterized protein CELE_C47E12.9 [Caenorhabditis elegans]|eukprot:NP_501796.2 Uncharacterized protein CELE_C47E12.9 [Caenorhabditis elegans]
MANICLFSIFLVLLSFFKNVVCEDQVMVHTFEYILHDYAKQWIVELTYEFNEQNNLEDSRKTVMKAIDQNWAPVMAIPFCAPVGKRDPVLMNPIEKVKENVEIFVNYRDALKTYSDKVLEKSISLGLFEYSEIEKIRELFWEVEMRSSQTLVGFKNFQKCFFRKIAENYSSEVAQKFEDLSEEVIESDFFLKTQLHNENELIKF